MSWTASCCPRCRSGGPCWMSGKAAARPLSFFGSPSWRKRRVSPYRRRDLNRGMRKGLTVQPARPLTASRGDWIRTSDHLHPMQVRYRAALHPENLVPHFAATIPPTGGVRYRAALHPETVRECRGTPDPHEAHLFLAPLEQSHAPFSLGVDRRCCDVVMCLWP